MKRTTIEKLRNEAARGCKCDSVATLPLPVDDGRRRVQVFVEGYEDVAFWRSIFDHFQNDYLRFEISVPNRDDLPKGKKVLLSMIPRSGEELLLCVDSDFDYLFEDRTETSREVNGAQFMFHTYTYATENYLCYAPSLHNVCVKATKNDSHIFDFVQFMADYSRTIYPVFLWYAYSAQLSHESVFTLVEFKNTVRLGFLEVERNGADTLAWLCRQVQRKLHRLESLSSVSYGLSFLSMTGFSIVIYLPSSPTNAIMLLRMPIMLAAIPTQVSLCAINVSSRSLATCKSSFAAFSDFPARKSGSCINSLIISFTIPFC